MTIVKPLYGYNSQENSYMVESYPYGRLRCKIWFWIEYGGDKKGYRFCSVTENPKTGRINAPKKGTYALLAQEMYLDENNHVHASALSEYSKPEEVLSFIQTFSEMNPNSKRILEAWCHAKSRLCKKQIENNKAIYANEPLTEHGRERIIKEQNIWDESLTLLG